MKHRIIQVTEECEGAHTVYTVNKDTGEVLNTFIYPPFTEEEKRMIKQRKEELDTI